MKYTYRVYDRPSGKLLAQGSTRECAEQLGMKHSGFQSAVDRMRDGVIGKFVIEEFGGPQDTEQDRIDLAEQWDRFCEPLRKKYGVKIRRVGDDLTERMGDDGK